MKTKNLRDAVEVVLADAAVNRGAAFTAQEFLREVVNFANTGETPNVLARGPSPWPMDADTIDGVRRRLRANLQALVDGRLTPADRKRIYAAADRVLLIPRTDADGHVLYQYIPANFEAVIAHGMALLLGNQDQDDLKQCQWKDCNRSEDAQELPHVRRFFFVSQRREAKAAGKAVTGKRPDRYCCEQHMREAHRERATAATIARREKLRKQKQAAAPAAAKRN